ncbi:MAG TPA: hypothetical protein VF533_04450 [Solirubrobacteraceae bacterium]|jgi:hypothetical protein
MPPWLSLDRILALAGLAGLLVVGVIALSMLAGIGDDDGGAETEAAATATPTPTRTPEPTPTPTPTPTPLTAEERAERSAAADQIRQQGYEPVSLRTYHPDQDLRVMLGEPSDATRAAGVPEGRRAFFFVGDSFIGTDASEVSSDLQIARQTRRSTTLLYGLDTGEDARVRFVWDGTSLAPQSEIPPADQRQE